MQEKRFVRPPPLAKKNHARTFFTRSTRSPAAKMGKTEAGKKKTIQPVRCPHLTHLLVHVPCANFQRRRRARSRRARPYGGRGCPGSPVGVTAAAWSWGDQREPDQCENVLHRRFRQQGPLPALTGHVEPAAQTQQRQCLVDAQAKHSLLLRGYSMIQRLRGHVRGCCRTGLKGLGSFEAVSGFLGGGWTCFGSWQSGPGSARTLGTLSCFCSECNDRGLGRVVFVSTL